MAVTTVWAAVLIIYGVSTGTAKDPELNDLLPLDMAPNSVDDMYRTCEDKMWSKVKKYLQTERKKDLKFKEAWDKALRWGEAQKSQSLGRNPTEIPSTALRKELAMAIYVYSLNDIYQDFNNAVRSQKLMYLKKFKYHSLHFYLTEALKTLKAQNNQGCFIGYRGVNKYFRQDVVNQKIRFGSFTSTSRKYDVALRFGTLSCFEILTCCGADISLYSNFPSESEVLIPPYEIFKVTNISKKSEDKNLKCDVVYKLESAGISTHLNCALFAAKQ